MFFLWNSKADWNLVRASILKRFCRRFSVFRWAYKWQLPPVFRCTARFASMKVPPCQKGYTSKMHCKTSSLVDFNNATRSLHWCYTLASFSKLVGLFMQLPASTLSGWTPIQTIEATGSTTLILWFRLPCCSTDIQSLVFYWYPCCVWGNSLRMNLVANCGLFRSTQTFALSIYISLFQSLVLIFGHISFTTSNAHMPHLRLVFYFFVFLQFCFMTCDSTQTAQWPDSRWREL